VWQHSRCDIKEQETLHLLGCNLELEFVFDCTLPIL